MKKYILLFTASAMLLGTVSCVESSSKYKALLAQRDSLSTQAQTLEGNYNQTLEALNEVEAGFQSIRESEGIIALNMQNIEGQSKSKKEQLAAEINQVKEILAQNKEKIAQLQGRLAASGKENKTLAATIQRLQNELNEKSALVASLQEELSRKNVKIAELNTTVEGLNKDVSNLNQVSAEQKATISAQDASLNTVHYLVATERELKDAKIITKNGLFASKEIMKGAFSKDLFTTIDLRQLSELPLQSKKAKVMSSHPAGSYKMVEAENGMITLQITDSQKFWSVSKYLVVSASK